MAASCCVCPGARERADGETVIGDVEFAGAPLAETTMLAVSGPEVDVAVKVAWPGPMPVAAPDGVIPTTVGSLELQITAGLLLLSPPSDMIPITDN